MKTLLAAAILSLCSQFAHADFQRTFTVPTSSQTFTVPEVSTATCLTIAYNTGASPATVYIGDAQGRNIFTLLVPAGFPLLGDEVIFNTLSASPFTISATAAGIRFGAKCKQKTDP